MSILFFSRGRSRTQLQLIPRSLQRATSSAPGPSAKSSTAASEEKTEANGASQSSEPAKQGFTNEYFRNLMLKKNWKPISNIEKVSVIWFIRETAWVRLQQGNSETATWHEASKSCIFFGLTASRQKRTSTSLIISDKKTAVQILINASLRNEQKLSVDLPPFDFFKL